MLLGGKSLGSARHWQPVLRMYITPLINLADSDAPFAAAGLARRDQRLDMRPFPHRSGRSDNAVCRGCSAGGCRQSHMGHLKSKFTTPENHS